MQYKKTGLLFPVMFLGFSMMKKRKHFQMTTSSRAPIIVSKHLVRSILFRLFVWMATIMLDIITTISTTTSSWQGSCGLPLWKRSLKLQHEFWKNHESPRPTAHRFQFAGDALNSFLWFLIRNC
jgi:hypothetical protein